MIKSEQDHLNWLSTKIYDLEAKKGEKYRRRGKIYNQTRNTEIIKRVKIRIRRTKEKLSKKNNIEKEIEQRKTMVIGYVNYFCRRKDTYK